MYTILPFRFTRIRKQYLLTNDAGEFIFLSDCQFLKLTDYSLDIESSEFGDLKSKFFVTDTSIDEVIDILSIRYRTKKKHIFEGPSLHMIVPTIRCNSKCTYCQVSSKHGDEPIDKSDMDLTTARKVVDIIFQTPCRNIKIEFQGGEPSLNFSVIKFVVRYANLMAKRAEKNVDYVICTNMLNINNSTLKFIKKYHIYISTSLDGPEDIHTSNRPCKNSMNSYRMATDNIVKAQEFLGSDNVSALLTVTANNLYRLKDVVDEYKKRGFSSIFIRPLNPFGRARENNDKDYSPEEFIEQYIECLEYIIQLNKDGELFVEEFAVLLLQRILTPFGDGFVDLQSPSGAGLMCAVYNYDGSIYASDEGRMLGEMGDNSFKLGNIKSTYNEIFKNHKIEQIINHSILEQFPECTSCPYVPYCGCDIVRDYAESNVLFSRMRNSISCKLIKPIFQFLFEKIQSEDGVDILYSWLH